MPDTNGNHLDFIPLDEMEERELRRRLAEIRSFGLSTSVETLTRGAFSVAAPVRAVPIGIRKSTKPVGLSASKLLLPWPL